MSAGDEHGSGNKHGPGDERSQRMHAPTRTTPSTAREEAGGARCPNCGVAIVGAYCHACGQEQHLTHSAFAILGKTVVDFAQLDHVLARTLLELARAPGRMIADVLRGKSKPYAKPLATLVLLASTYFVLLGWSDLIRAIPSGQSAHAGVVAQQISEQVLERVRAMTTQWGQYLNLVNVPIAAAVLWALNGRAARSYGAWVVFMGYTAAGTSLMALVFLLACLGHPSWYHVMSMLQIPGMAIYAAWAAHGAFGFGWWRALLRVGVPMLIVAMVLGALFGFVCLIVLVMQSM